MMWDRDAIKPAPQPLQLQKSLRTSRRAAARREFHFQSLRAQNRRSASPQAQRCLERARPHGQPEARGSVSSPPRCSKIIASGCSSSIFSASWPKDGSKLSRRLDRRVLRNTGRQPAAQNFRFRGDQDANHAALRRCIARRRNRSTSWLGIARPGPMAIMELIPITRPLASASGPPEFPAPILDRLVASTACRCAAPRRPHEARPR